MMKLFSSQIESYSWRVDDDEYKYNENERGKGN